MPTPFFKVIIGLTLFLFICSAYAYIIDARRKEDDPQKKHFMRAAVFLIPALWPLIFLAYIFIVILRALVYGLFLVLFTVAVLVVREPFLLKWLHKTATYIGDRLLAANTFLLKMAFGNWAKNPGGI